MKCKIHNIYYVDDVICPLCDLKGNEKAFEPKIEPLPWYYKELEDNRVLIQKQNETICKQLDIIYELILGKTYGGV